MRTKIPFVIAALLAIGVLMGAARPQIYGNTIVLASVDGGTIPDASTVYGGMMNLVGTGLVVSNGTSWSAPGVTTTQANAQYFQLLPESSYPTARQRTTIQTKVAGVSTTNYFQYGMTFAQNALGTPTVDLTLTYPAITWTTGTAANNGAGIFGSEANGYTEWDNRPLFASNIRIPANGTQGVEMWVGLITGTVFSNPPPQAGPVSSVGWRLIAFGFNDAQGPNWWCCAADNSNQSCTSTGVAVTINTDYTMIADYSTAGTLTCTVNGTSVNHTTNLPTGSADAPQLSVRMNNEGPGDGGTKAFVFYDWTMTQK